MSRHHRICPNCGGNCLHCEIDAGGTVWMDCPDCALVFRPAHDGATPTTHVAQFRERVREYMENNPGIMAKQPWMTWDE